MTPVWINHKLEAELRAPASDILEAISRRFRSRVNVRGALAELYLYRKLQVLQRQGLIKSVEWLDADGEPDFVVNYKQVTLRIECKNVRNETYASGSHKGWFKVETQKTRTGKDPKTGQDTRPYSIDQFDVLAACLFPQTNQWEYLFCASRDLRRHDRLKDRLATFQAVPRAACKKWTDNLKTALDKAYAGKVGR